MDDSEDEFQPNDDDDDDDAEEDDVFEAADGPEAGASDSDGGGSADADEAPQEDLSIQEIEPAPTPARPRRAPAAKNSPSPPAQAAEGTGVHADDVLQTIPDAALPEAPESEGKLNYFALKSKQQSVAAPSGAVELPEAAPNCLGGLTLVFTGVLPNLDRDASESVAKRYGARVTKSILKKTSLVVVGDEAGPAKVKKIRDLGIKAIDEAGFIELLARMPADGGASASAQAAKRKREEEEQAILAQARAEETAEREREAKRQKPEAKRARAQAPGGGGAASTAAPLPPAPRREVPNSEKLWTVKYAPDSLAQICGNKGQVAKLRSWLLRWFDNARKDFKAPGADGSGVFRAALISGPPGIGKTTAAHLVAKELGFDVLEKNASDVRSKALLNSDIKSVLNNTSVVGFFKHHRDAAPHANERRFCLIMDEVDGMSSGDHGGAGALSAFCRITRMPMILICNDKSLPKMRTFDKVTFGLPFKRPSEVEMKARLLTIAHREHLKLDPSVIGKLVQATGNDIRQIINLMSTVSKTQKVIGHENSKQIADSWKKHVMLKPFDITSTLLAGPIFNPSSGSTLNDKLDLYFNDIDFAPLMIQENYLVTRPRVLSQQEHLRRVAAAADAISESDRISSLIRSSEQQWSLLPFHGVMSTVKPAMETNGSIMGRINFTSWLGNFSKTNKNMRLLQELQYHARLRTSTSKSDFRLDYVPVLRDALTKPLLSQGEAGILEVIDTMDQYFFSKDDWDSVLELGVGAKTGPDILKGIPTKVKSAFTRKYNGMSHPVAIYKTGNSVGSGAASKQKVDYEDVVEDDTAKDEDEPVEDSGEIDSKKDKLIKKLPAGKKTAKKGKKKAA
ncbi:DNA replication factor C, large subunit [Metschnikowia bicuspidata var. bicuspidata NRRL YB-4993]|uniref:Replication factor C subunit 1 n=1 Tax=Metschnikowia bicuspidata var. bicuspidata NRRL YB-4993 TaxID=869754 RepID=A0A1A0HDK6_9ASCO|nr:DNA replication factor C, large subunit [Metschnikowia bicuspidata var. bicuspidata NRRL YB-4993]OBA21977.1 DNA replication factor C, large subunit [Metschnikowia bicuspidata var. bicuspidata NRRL YB-4993]